MQLLGAGAATGVGVRSLMGLGEMFNQPTIDPQVSAQVPQTLKLHAPPEEKQANALDWAASKLQNIIPTPDTKAPLANEWGIPLGVGAAGTGIYGGYKLVDWLLNKEKERNNKSQLQSAEDDYNNALSEQYAAAMQAKQAGDDLGIDALADSWMGRDKEAENSIFETISRWGDGIPVLGHITNYPKYGIGNDNWRALQGAGNTAILMAGLGSGLATYNWAKGRNKKELLAKALKKRQQQRARLSPPPIMAELEESNAAA